MNDYGPGGEHAQDTRECGHVEINPDCEQCAAFLVQLKAASGGEPPAGEPAESDEPAGFDTEAFVRALPEGVNLCPQCLGFGAIVADPPFDPYSHVCRTCSGYGRLRTGSLVGAEGEHNCPDCNGRGWQPNEPGTPPATPAAPEQFAGELPPRDFAGRTPDDPEFDWSRVVTQQVASEPPAAVEPSPAV